jgi:hypothetical protein
MVKILRAHRVSGDVLGSNCKFLQEREAIRKWFKRTQVTIYMRKRSRKLALEWNSKLMRTCWEAIRENNHNDKKFVRKLVQLYKRMSNLDVSKSFQHWHHTAQSIRQRESESTTHGSRSIA